MAEKLKIKHVKMKAGGAAQPTTQNRKTKLEHHELGVMITTKNPADGSTVVKKLIPWANITEVGLVVEQKKKPGRPPKDKPEDPKK